MPGLLDKRTLFIGERIGLKSAGEVYDLIDPDTKHHLGCAREELCLGGILARWFLDRSFLTMKVVIEDSSGRMLLTLKSPPALWGRRFFLHDSSGNLVAIFRSRFHWRSCLIDVCSADNKPLGHLTGDFRATAFSFTGNDGRTIGEINHHAGGMLKDLFTSADNYQVRLLGDQEQAGLLFAAAIIVDLIFHED
jgi:uncharacterized protein YxjI